MSKAGGVSGLKVILNFEKTNAVQRPNDPHPGLLVFVNDPSEWPNFAYTIWPGVDATVGITPTVYHTSPDLKGFSIADRDCVYDVS